MSADPECSGDGERSGRWELVRALGAVCDTPEAANVAARALGLGELAKSDHTLVFVMNCAPYAAVHLGPEGKLGGEGADRVAGFWRAVGLVPPPEPDHLTALLSLYASLGEAGDDAQRPATRSTLIHLRQALVWEHLWPWVPGYADAVADLAVPVLSPWAELLRSVLDAEVAGGLGKLDEVLPLALRQAPAPLSSTDDLDGVLDALVAPLRSGMVITRQSLGRASGEVGVGHRIGERRFTLRAMLEQDPAATLAWMAGEAARRAGRLDPAAPGAHRDITTRWWERRSHHTHLVLSKLAAATSPAEPATSGAGRSPVVGTSAPSR